MPKHHVLLAPVAGAFATCLIAGCSMMGFSASPDSQSGASPHPSAVAVSQSPQQRKMASLAGQADGPGGGWIIAAPAGHLDAQRLDRMRRANLAAEQRPAGPGDVSKSDTADLNHDGFVTLDEIIAMRRAHLDDAALIRRLRATGYVFAMSDRQRAYLKQRGISQGVIDAVGAMNGAGPGRMAAASTKP